MMASLRLSTLGSVLRLQLPAHAAGGAGSDLGDIAHLFHLTHFVEKIGEA